MQGRRHLTFSTPATHIYLLIFAFLHDAFASSVGCITLALPFAWIRVFKLSHSCVCKLLLSDRLSQLCREVAHRIVGHHLFFILRFSQSRILLINFRQHKYKQTIVNKKIISHKKGSMSNLLYGKVESYFALVKWIKIKGKPISIFPSVEKEIILNNNDRIFIKAYRTIIDTTCLIISYLFTLLLLFFWELC